MNTDVIGFLVGCEVCGSRVLLRTSRQYVCDACAEVAATSDPATSLADVLSDVALTVIRFSQRLSRPRDFPDDDDYPLGEVRG